MSTLLNRRRTMMMSSSGFHELPSTYTALEYLENPNNAYIAMDFKTDYGQIIETELMTINSPNQAIMGGRTHPTNGYVLWFDHKNGQPIYAFNPSSDTYGRQINCVVGVKYYIKVELPDQPMQPYNFQVGNETVVGASCGKTLSGYNWNPFRAANDSRYFTGRIYWIKVAKSDEVQLWLIPCINDNGVYGMWDKVEGKFYGSANQSVFTGQ